MAGAALFAEQVLPRFSATIKMDNLRAGSRSRSLAAGSRLQQGIDQRIDLAVCQMKSRHVLHRLQDGCCQLLRRLAFGCLIQVGSKPVAPVADNVAAAAGVLIEQPLALADHGGFTQGEAGVAAGDQLLVGNVFPVGGRVAPVAAGTAAALAGNQRA
ncbi:MAG: hypothetical protein H6Q56_1109 [Deltaproteobacteria bacterium]|nr:hypothetical protein [Deltaproteobacteria bacterium]